MSTPGKSKVSSFVHPSSIVDLPCEIGEGTHIWHFCHIMSQAVIGNYCNLGQNVFVASGVKVGDYVKIQNNVSLYEGVTLEDYVFCGPSCVFTNIPNPRSELVRKGHYLPTVVRRGASIGANATLICGTEIGRYAMISAGAAVTRQRVPDYALMVGVPAIRKGWVSRHGHRLQPRADDLHFRCPESGWKYEETNGTLRCLDYPEDQPLEEYK
jgi:UDP-2-acetamido-3-amino-2,3-dideoxy-glucuronate N-acetyltransferase